MGVLELSLRLWFDLRTHRLDPQPTPRARATYTSWLSFADTGHRRNTRKVMRVKIPVVSELNDRFSLEKLLSEIILHLRANDLEAS